MLRSGFNRKLSSIILAVGLAIGFCACSGKDEKTENDGRVGSGRPAVGSLVIGAPADAGDKIDRAIEDILAWADGRANASLGLTAPSRGAFLKIEAAGAADFGPLGFELAAEKNGGVITHTLRATDEMGVVYGIYAYGELLGLRYLHPERIFVPDRLEMPPAEDIVETSPYDKRGFHIHTQHPLPMTEFLLNPSDQSLPYIEHWIDWLVYNRQNMLDWYLLNAVPDFDAWVAQTKKVADYAHDRGVLLGIQFGFQFAQQNAYNFFGANRRLSSDDRANIEMHLERIMQVPFDYLILQSGGSEWVPPDQAEELKWMNMLVETVYEKYPGTSVTTWIHPKSDLISNIPENDGGYYFHNVKYADPRMGLMIHTVMHATLYHPAFDIYDNENFDFQRELLLEEAAKTGPEAHPVQYMPESAYWCTFDIDVPNFFPLYIYSRAYDLIKLADVGLDFHLTFTSGHEWGFWLNDYSVARISAAPFRGLTTDQYPASPEPTDQWREPIKHASAIYGRAADEVAEIIMEMTEYQFETLFLGDLLGYWSGEDFADDAGIIAGIHTHPMRRRFWEFADDTAAELDEFEATTMVELENAERKYTEWLARLIETKYVIPTAAEEFYLELRDCVEIGVLRIRHSLELYRGTIAARRAELDGGDPADAAAANFAEARRLTVAAIGAGLEPDEDFDNYPEQIEPGVVERREPYYRYPIEYTAEKTDTVTAYTFRYLWMARSGYNWARQDAEAVLREFKPGLMLYYMDTQ